MTAVEEVRKAKMPGERDGRIVNYTAIAIFVVLSLTAFFRVPDLASTSTRAMVFTIVLVAARDLCNRRIHKELVQEIDALRQELDQLKKTP